MNRELLSSVLGAVRHLRSTPKVAFVPGPAVQGQLQRLMAMAADGGNDQEAAAMAQQQAQAQGQGAPPAMRIEDLAGMIDQGFQQLAGLIQQAMAPPPAPAPAAAAAPAAPAAAPAGGEGGGGEAKKPKTEDLILDQLTQMNNMLRQMTGAPPPGAAPMPAGQPPAAPAGQPAAAPA